MSEITDDDRKIWARAASENSILRHIIKRCAEALGNGAAISPNASIEFMENLPREIELHVARLRAEADKARELALNCANVGYRVCAETRHVTLGEKVREEITKTVTSL